MNEKVLKCLFDLKIAVEENESFFEPVIHNFEAYKRNTLLKRTMTDLFSLVDIIS